MVIRMCIFNWRRVDVLNTLMVISYLLKILLTECHLQFSAVELLPYSWGFSTKLLLVNNCPSHLLIIILMYSSVSRHPSYFFHNHPSLFAHYCIIMTPSFPQFLPFYIRKYFKRVHNLKQWNLKSVKNINLWSVEENDVSKWRLGLC